ncbi:hypothetical protein MNV49_001311 [Pseudohyphozyma bogoriensis]|nr:hypothetical protein MNV49_001311 [Pseudohyphozyma bogoriensis]
MQEQSVHYSPIVEDSTDGEDRAIPLRDLPSTSTPKKHSSKPSTSSTRSGGAGAAGPRLDPTSPRRRQQHAGGGVTPDGTGRESYDEQEEEDEEAVLELMGLRDDNDEDYGKTSEEEEGGKRGPMFKDEGDVHNAVAMVKKIVPESDDPTMTTLTFRVVLLGSILCIFGAAVSQLFFFKSNAPSFSSFFIILLAFPLGHLCANHLPDREYSFFENRVRFSLNPGPFSKKEHLLIGVLAGSGASAAYAGEIISVQDLYYHTELGAIGGLLLLLSTQLIGFGFAGLTYRLLVRPSSMLWPSTLVYVTLYETLHGGAKENVKETRDRMRYFSLSFLGIFSWQFLPAVVFPTLTSIAVLCLLDNNNIVMRTLGSGFDGFGLLDFSLDWSVIGGTGALYTPFFAQSCYLLGLAFNMWIVMPFLYFTNFWNARSYDSPLAAHLYNSTFGRFDVMEILNPDLSLNETRYAEIQPIRLTPYFALSYGVSFAVLTSAIATVILWHSGDIRSAFASRGVAGDIHVEMLERSYKPIPKSYYLTVLFSMLAGSTALVLFFPVQLPVWGLYLAIILALIFLVPVGIIAAITNTTLGLNVITEFVAGFLWPGKPIANIVFKVYGYMTLVQCIDLTADMKLGLYCKIPPRSLFICQVYGTALGSVVNYSLIRGVINAKRPYLDGTLIDPTSQWSGRSPEIFMSASTIWGLVGPARFFSGQYHVLYYGFLIGVFLPVFPWLMYKRYGGHFWSNISIPLILHGSIGPPQRPTNIIIPGFIVSFLSQFYALRYHTKWFEKYCYVLSSALDAGTSINALTIYIFGLSSFSEWWGNSAVDTEHCVPGS